MADNEDPKDKIVSAPAAKPVAKPADAVGAKLSPSVDGKPKSPDLKSPNGSSLKELAAKGAKPAPAMPLGVPPARIEPPKKVEAAPAPPVKAPFAAPAVAAADAKMPALTAKAAPRPKIKTDPLAQAKPVEPVVPAARPVIEVAKDVKSALAPVTSPKATTPQAALKTAATKPVFAGLFTNFMLEETNMDMSTNFAGIQDAMAEAQAKAKAAFEKSTNVLGEVSEFTKGNVEAVVASGKILAEGVQGMGSELVAEGRSAFEAMTGDIKELAAAKSPTDFFKIQGDMMRKNFDSAVAYGSKNSEAMLKLFSDSFAPISGRMSIAMEKARSVSL